MLEVLTNPNGFFHNKINDEVEMKTPLMIMAVLALVGVISSVLIIQKTMEMLPPEAAKFAPVGIVAGIIGAIIGTLLTWIIYSGLFYLISMFFNGEGDFKRLLEFTSYGFIPSIVSGLISAYYTNQLFDNLDFSNPELMQELIKSDPSMKIVSIIGIVFLLWSANIWIFAIAYSRNISVKNATIVVGLPILLYVLYVASQFF
ncbi:Yip1 family protein [Methanolobus sp. ZRKC3]|uniref:YIP1 family protein n=1 Tax=Methanolobus sp. ZRKC3 TaxID=3125786 RepID=UPI00324748A0